MKLLILHILFAVFLISCASQGRISGGPKDTQPPKVVINKSTPNEQVQFKKQEIDLYFDEFVEVKNALKEMVISPPLEFLPKLDHRGKKATFKFNDKEILKEDATYSINFGHAIKDFRAGNPLDNYSFVFSTGDFIDSLSISGKVILGKDNKPVSDMLVMLYTDLRDSVPYLEKPFYSTRTDKEGSFTINNIKEDTFKIFALKDENVNYLFDLDKELIAYQNDFLILTDSSKYNNIELLAFQEDPELRIIEVNDKQKGRLSVLFNQELSDVDYNWTGSQELIQVLSKDSLLLYYDTTQVLAGDTLFFKQDTFLIKTPRAKSVVPSFNIKQNKPDLTNPIAPFDTIYFQSYTPIRSIQKDSFQVQDTSQFSVPFVLDIVNERYLKLTISQKNNKAPLSLTLFPNALKDIYNQTNQDTLSYLVRYLDKEATGIINLNFAPLLQDTFEYIIEFRIKNQVFEKFTSSELIDSIKSYNYMKPGDYSLFLIQDKNKNGRQDAGSYLSKEGPDPEREIQFQTLRADWTIEEKIDWNAEPAEKQEKKSNLDDESDKSKRPKPSKRVIEGKQ